MSVPLPGIEDICARWDAAVAAVRSGDGREAACQLLPGPDTPVAECYAHLVGIAMVAASSVAASLTDRWTRCVCGAPRDSESHAADGHHFFALIDTRTGTQITEPRDEHDADMLATGRLVVAACDQDWDGLWALITAIWPAADIGRWSVGPLLELARQQVAADDARMGPQ